jgi:hypothetical protein
MASEEASVPPDLGGESNLIQGVANRLHLHLLLSLTSSFDPKFSRLYVYFSKNLRTCKFGISLAMCL